MKKEKLKLRKEIKTILILIVLMILTLCFIDIANARCHEIENNPNAYKTRSIQVNFTK